MKRVLVTAAAVVLATAASAQQSTTGQSSGGPAVVRGGPASLTPAQVSAIRTYVVKERRPSVAAPSGFAVSTGAVVPQAVELYTFPADVGVTDYRYTVVGGQTVLVEPTTRRVIQVVE